MDDFLGGSRLGRWADQAVCQQVDPELFYPELPTPTIIEQAKLVCNYCPVKADCLQHAIDNHERYGVWGGTTPQERERMFRLNRLKQRAAERGLYL